MGFASHVSRGFSSMMSMISVISVHQADTRQYRSMLLLPHEMFVFLRAENPSTSSPRKQCLSPAPYKVLTQTRSPPLVWVQSPWLVVFFAPLVTEADADRW